MATTDNTESLRELERQAETTRAELAQTVDALHNRVSPAALKADVVSYVKENPLQAAAVAVGVAYPLWRIVGSIPAPVLLIGAGLAMSRKNGSSSYGYSRSSSDGYGYAGSSSSGQGMMASLKEKASDLTSRISDKASDLTSRLTDKAQDTMDSVRETVSEKTARASDMLSSTYQSSRDTASDTAEQLSAQASETYARTRDTMADVIERYPLLVGGVAFAVGSLLALSVPVSRRENQLMGSASDELKHRGEDLAAQGMRQAQDAARQVYQTASSQVREQGMTPEAARNTARAAVETARDAVEQTLSGGGVNGRSGPSSQHH